MEPTSAKTGDGGSEFLCIQLMLCSIIPDGRAALFVVWVEKPVSVLQCVKEDGGSCGLISRKISFACIPQQQRYSSNRQEEISIIRRALITSQIILSVLYLNS
jgi:hypothetical protein